MCSSISNILMNISVFTKCLLNLYLNVPQKLYERKAPRNSPTHAQGPGFNPWLYIVKRKIKTLTLKINKWHIHEHWRISKKATARWMPGPRDRAWLHRGVSRMLETGMSHLWTGCSPWGRPLLPTVLVGPLAASPILPSGPRLPVSDQPFLNLSHPVADNPGERKYFSS